jgi:hypothetical protein
VVASGGDSGGEFLTRHHGSSPYGTRACAKSGGEWWRVFKNKCVVSKNTPL